MQAPEVRRAVAAVTAIGAALDLTVDDAIVLHNSNKLALRLLPCDVFARVSPVGHEVAQLEIELALRLAETESPVAALEPRVEPRVYERDGFVVTLWTYYESLAPPTSHPPTTPMRSSGCTPACGRSMCRRRISRTELRRLSNSLRAPTSLRRSATRIGSCSADVANPATSDRRTRRRRAVAARRAAPGQRAQHEIRAAVHRPRDVLPGPIELTSRTSPTRSASVIRR